MWDTIAGSPNEKLIALARRIAVTLLLTATPIGGILQGQVKHQKGFLHPFEHVGMNIFVPVTITGLDGRSDTVDFILDSGTNRTTIDPSVARELTLLPYRTSSNVTPSGTSLRYTSQIPHLCSLSQCTDNLEVLVDDLSLFTNGYGRRVGGLLAMDFLEKYILLIDFPNSQIGFLPANAKLKDFAKAKVVNLISEKNLTLVEALLPNGRTVRLIFDTGYDSLADALLYESASGELSFVQTGESEVKDGNGSYPVKSGKVQSLKLGEIRFAPAFVQMSKQTSAQKSTLEYAGMIGVFPFRKNVIAVDYPKLKLLVLARSNSDQTDKSK
jgi:hypothetical protein